MSSRPSSIIAEEPLTGDALHKAIILDRKAEVEKILDSPDGPRVLEVLTLLRRIAQSTPQEIVVHLFYLKIPDKFGNLPLMSAVSKNNLE